MKKNVKFFGCALILLFAMSACEKDDSNPVPDPNSVYEQMIASYNNEMVLKWDGVISSAIDKTSPNPVESRSYAMVTLAMHDALNNVYPKYETYAMKNGTVITKTPSEKDFTEMANAAVAQAAYDVLIFVAPGWKAQADEIFDQYLTELALHAGGIGEITEVAAKGLEIGHNAASAILAKRQNDLRPAFVTYPQGTQPGEYRSYLPFTKANPPRWPENAVFAPDWGNLTPFGLNSGNQFRPVPPYPVNSPEYTADYNEVKRLGCNECPDRTQEQSDMGAFFIENAPSSMNRVAKIMVMDENMNGWEAARFLALTHMIQADALIAVFDAKYFYNTWRPITAIREGDNDGNDATVGDPTWINLKRPEIRPIPAIPDYPSTRAAAGAAGAELFKLYFGTDDKSFTIGSYSLPDAERSYTSFSQLANEISLSRIYVGYHFRNDVEQGEKMGRQLADFVYKNQLRELVQ